MAVNSALEGATDEDQNMWCNWVHFKSSDNGDILVTNYTSVKRVKLNFEKPSLIISYSTVSEIVNEKPMYAMIDVKGAIFNLGETKQKVCKNSEVLQLRKTVARDSTDCVPITFLDKNVSTISKAKGYQIANVGVSPFQAQRILKTTETTEIIEDDNCKYNVTEVERSTSSLSLSQKKKQKKPKVTLVSVNFKLFDKRFICSRCNQEKIPDNEITCCDSSNVMTTSDCYNYRLLSQ